MYESFENLPEEKKKNIIYVCIEEFAEKGYENASTNTIVKKAKISKGILFHYFQNKKNLYLYMLDYVIENFTDKLYSLNVKLSPDIFERLMQIGFIKLRMAYAEPLMYKMLFQVFIKTPDALKEDIGERYSKIYAEALSKLYDGLDMSKFRKDIDIQKAIEIIGIFLDGLQRKYVAAFGDMNAEEVLAQMDKLIDQYREYFEILKKGIYENE